MGTSLQSPWVMNSYSDTINGKIVFENWTDDGKNITVGTVNYSNGDNACAFAFYYKGMSGFYLKDVFNPWLNFIDSCIPGQPIPDTIGIFTQRIWDEPYDLDTTYFVIVGQDPSLHPELIIYPNPTLNSVTIESAESRNSAELADVIGRVLISISPLNQNQSLNLEPFSAGCYFLRVRWANGEYDVKKIVKMKE